MMQPFLIAYEPARQNAEPVSNIEHETIALQPPKGSTSKLVMKSPDTLLRARLANQCGGESVGH